MPDHYGDHDKKKKSDTGNKIQKVVKANEKLLRGGLSQIGNEVANSAKGVVRAAKETAEKIFPMQDLRAIRNTVTGNHEKPGSKSVAEVVAKGRQVSSDLGMQDIDMGPMSPGKNSVKTNKVETRTGTGKFIKMLPSKRIKK